MRCKPLSLLLGVGVFTILSATGLYFFGKVGSIGKMGRQLSFLNLSQWSVLSEENSLATDQEHSMGLQVHEKSKAADVVMDDVRATATENEKGEAQRNLKGEVTNTARSELVPISVTRHLKEENDEQRLAVNFVSLSEADVTKETLGPKTNDETATSQADRTLIQSKISPRDGVGSARSLR